MSARLSLLLAVTLVFVAVASGTTGQDPSLDRAEGLPIHLVSGVATACDPNTVDPDGDVLLEARCDTGEIRPGAWAYGCTLDFVMTDGTDHYIATAGHCGGVGKRWSVPGVGAFGTTVYRAFDYTDLSAIRDWALILIDPEDVPKIDATMYRFGGPYDNAPGVLARPAIPGETVFQYGHGAGMGKEDATKGRLGEVIGLLGTNAFVYAGMVGGGDSGSPVRFATGEAAGIAVAYIGIATGDNRGKVPAACATIDGTSGGASDTCIAWDTLCPHIDGACAGPLRPGNGGPLVIVTSFTAALDAFEGHLGRPLTIIEGDLPQATLDA